MKQIFFLCLLLSSLSLVSMEEGFDQCNNNHAQLKAKKMFFCPLPPCPVKEIVSIKTLKYHIAYDHQEYLSELITNKLCLKLHRKSRKFNLYLIKNDPFKGCQLFQCISCNYCYLRETHPSHHSCEKTQNRTRKSFLRLKNTHFMETKEKIDTKIDTLLSEMDNFYNAIDVLANLSTSGAHQQKPE